MKNNFSRKLLANKKPSWSWPVLVLLRTTPLPLRHIINGESQSVWASNDASYCLCHLQCLRDAKAILSCGYILDNFQNQFCGNKFDFAWSLILLMLLLVDPGKSSFFSGFTVLQIYSKNFSGKFDSCRSWCTCVLRILSFVCCCRYCWCRFFVVDDVLAING